MGASRARAWAAAWGVEEDARLKQAGGEAEETGETEVVGDQAYAFVDRERTLVERGLDRVASAPGSACERREEGDAGALVAGPGEGAVGLQLELPELMAERGACSRQVAQGVGGFEQVIDEGRMAQEVKREPAGGDDDGGLGALPESLEDGGEVNAAAQGEHVLEDEHGLRGGRPVSGPRTQQAFRRQQGLGGELFQGHGRLSPAG